MLKFKLYNLTSISVLSPTIWGTRARCERPPTGPENIRKSSETASPDKILDFWAQAKMRCLRRKFRNSGIMETLACFQMARAMRNAENSCSCGTLRIAERGVRSTLRGNTRNPNFKISWKNQIAVSGSGRRCSCRAWIVHRIDASFGRLINLQCMCICMVCMDLHVNVEVVLAINWVQF